LKPKEPSVPTHTVPKMPRRDERSVVDIERLLTPTPTVPRRDERSVVDIERLLTPTPTVQKMPQKPKEPSVPTPTVPKMPRRDERSVHDIERLLTEISKPTDKLSNLQDVQKSIFKCLGLIN